MENDTLKSDSLSKDTSKIVNYFDTLVSKDTSLTNSSFETLASKDLKQHSSTIETEHAKNDKLTLPVSVLSIVLAISIIFNAILLILLKRNMNKPNNKKMERQEENTTQITKLDTVANEDSEKSVKEATPSVQVTETSSTTNLHTEKESDNRIRLYTDTGTNSMRIYGMSIQGKGHLRKDSPCQDYHCVEIIDANKGMGIAVVSDGAGSAMNSEEGSKIVCESSIKYLKKAIEQLNWSDENNLPIDTKWNEVINKVVKLTQRDFIEKAKEMNVEIKSMAATFLMLFFTPKKTYFAHIGDGRAGVKTKASNEWKSIMAPHKGEEANQTIFITSAIPFPEDLTVSGIAVPETTIINEPISAFVLMSDGCENGLWIKSKKEDLPNGDFVYKEKNQPFDKALNPLIEGMTRFENKEEALLQFLDCYNKGLETETDDKTLVFGYIVQ